MGGGMNPFGGGGKGGGTSSGDAQDRLYEFAQEYFNQTQPQRDYWSGQFGQLQNGNLNLSKTSYAPQRDAIEAQYGNARDQILSSTPRGGAQTKALGDLSSNRARAVSGLTGNVIQDYLSKSYGAAYGAPQTSFSGLGNIAGVEAQRYGIDQGSKGAKGSGLGGLVGNAVGSYFGGGKGG